MRSICASIKFSVVSILDVQKAAFPNQLHLQRHIENRLLYSSIGCCIVQAPSKGVSTLQLRCSTRNFWYAIKNLSQHRKLLEIINP